MTNTKSEDRPLFEASRQPQNHSEEDRTSKLVAAAPQSMVNTIVLEEVWGDWYPLPRKHEQACISALPVAITIKDNYRRWIIGRESPKEVFSKILMK